jgi:hypothetical protein
MRFFLGVADIELTVVFLPDRWTVQTIVLQLSLRPPPRGYPVSSG